MKAVFGGTGSGTSWLTETAAQDAMKSRGVQGLEKALRVPGVAETRVTRARVHLEKARGCELARAPLVVPQ